MLWGAAIGDIAGSRFEFDNIKSRDFVLLGDGCFFTDDTVLTAAVAEALVCWRSRPGCDLSREVVSALRRWALAFPDRGYGGRFLRWAQSPSPAPYGSWGNGSAMRVSPCGWAAGSLAEARSLARTVSAVTHNHPQALLGAEAAASCVFLARTGAALDEIRRYVEDEFYRLDFTIDGIRADYAYDVSCAGTVPQALEAFLESTSFEDALRTAISLGGDSDTIAAITGAAAEAFYGVPPALIEKARGFLDAAIMEVFERFAAVFGPR